MSEEKGAPFRIVVTEFHPKPNPYEGVPIWSVNRAIKWVNKVGRHNRLDDLAPLFKNERINGEKLISELRYNDLPELNTFQKYHFWSVLSRLRMKYLINQDITEAQHDMNILKVMKSLGEWRHYDGDCSVSDGEFEHKCERFDVGRLGADVVKGEAFQRSCVAFTDKGHLKTAIPDNTAGLWIFHEKKQDEKAFLKAVALNQIDKARQLLCRGADYNSCDRNGRGALLFAAESGYTEIVDLLLNFNIEHQTTKKSGETSLLLASRRGHTAIVKLLLGYLERRPQHKELYRKKSKRGYTPLMAAANRGHAEVVSLLLQTEHIDDINVKTQMGWTPLTAAAHNGHFAVVEHLLKCGQEIDLSSDKYDFGNTLLMLACRHGHVDVVKALLKRKNIDIDVTNQGGGTALLIASYAGHGEIVKLLLENDPPADIEMRDKEGKTALMWAASGGYANTIKVLLQNVPPATVEQESKEGFTALQLCATRGYLDAVKSLVTHAEYTEGKAKEDLETTTRRVNKSIHWQVHDYLDELQHPEKKRQESSKKRQKANTPLEDDEPSSENSKAPLKGSTHAMKSSKDKGTNPCCCTIL